MIGVIDWSLLSSTNAYDITFGPVFRKHGFCALREVRNTINDCFLAIFDLTSFAQIHSSFSDHPMICAKMSFLNSQVQQLKSIFFRNADLIKLAERFNYFDAPAWDINQTLPNVYDAIEFCRMAFVPPKIRSQKAAHCYFSSHSIHAENILNTAKWRQRDNNIIEGLEKI